MRKFLKKLRKGLKTACLAAALTTCWNVGQIAKAGLLTLKFSGTVSPTTSDVSNLWLIYGSNYTTSLIDWHAVKLGDFTAGLTTGFTAYGEVISGYDLRWGVAGLHGDISGGQYSEVLNGVTLGLPDIDEGESWDSHVVTPIETMFGYLINDDSGSLADYHFIHLYIDNNFYSDGTISNLFDFSDAAVNGQMVLGYEPIPEPITLVLFGGGWFLVVASRRQKQ